jgi:2,4-dienoyl-CoA reductase-like NADH-dependent reductase (Old Yellow Enzyme family)
MDLIAIGRPLIANQDYMDKLANQIPMTDYSEEMLTELV